MTVKCEKHKFRSNPDAKENTVIEVKNLTKKYGEKLAVDHLSFEVNDGDVLGFLGPNGAGKSTTMNMLTGYLSATEGSVVVEGISMQENPEEAKRKIGYLPEIPPLYTDLTVMEYLRFVMRLKKVKGIRDAENYLTGICRRTGIEQVRGRLIRHLSKGYRQRVGIAQTLVGDPKILILDEPTVGLDPSQIVEIRSLIRDLGKEHTIILSSHILQEIQAICNRIIIIGEGKLLVDRKENELLEDDNGEKSEGRKEEQYYHVRIQGPAEKIALGLSRLPGVSRVSFENHVSENEYTFAVQAKEAGFREEAFDFCVRNGWKLLGLEGRERTLEDIFLQVTQK